MLFLLMSFIHVIKLSLFCYFNIHSDFWHILACGGEYIHIKESVWKEYLPVFDTQTESVVFFFFILMHFFPSLEE